VNILIGSGVPKRREGGVAAVIYNMGQELERLGHGVTYVFLDDLVEPGSVSPRFVELIFSVRLTRYIQQNSGKFSVVNLHAPAGVIYGLRRKWNRGNHLPYVLTLHGLEERRVRVMGREAARGRAWNFGWKNRLWHRVYHFPRFRWSIRTADAAHVFSRDVWNVLQLNYGFEPERCAYIPNGVEPRFFTPRASRGGDSFRLLYPGTWLDQRGIFYLRDAFRNVVRQLPRVTLTIAGPGVPAEQIARFFGEELAARIVVRGQVPAQDMPALYGEHDVLIFPSLMEGLPNVVLEAMASGMAVVTTATCGMPDVVEDEFNGLLIQPADAVAIERAILRLAKSEELRTRLGEAARESMRRHTWERTGQQLECLFLRVLQNETQRRRGA
jgi:glycosyltransferase involved in cell wall biosynthesis